MGRMAHLDERLGDGDEEGRDGGIGSEVAHSDAATRIDRHVFQRHVSSTARELHVSGC